MSAPNLYTTHHLFCAYNDQFLQQTPRPQPARPQPVRPQPARPQTPRPRPQPARTQPPRPQPPRRQPQRRNRNAIYYNRDRNFQLFEIDNNNNHGLPPRPQSARPQPPRPEPARPQPARPPNQRSNNNHISPPSYNINNPYGLGEPTLETYPNQNLPTLDGRLQGGLRDMADALDDL